MTRTIIAGGRDLPSNDCAFWPTLDREAVLAELANYRDLLPGWDGVDSIAIPEHAIEDASAFAQALPDPSPPLEAYPSADGFVGLFLVRDSVSCRANILFSGEGSVAYFAKSGSRIAKATRIWAAGDPIPADLAEVLADMVERAQRKGLRVVKLEG